MQDGVITIHDLREKIKKFVDERDWNQFHSPKNLSMAIAAEAAELMELFMWVDTEESRKHLEDVRMEVEDEVADVLIALLCFSNQAKMDLSAAMLRKLELNAKKYPIEKAKGRWEKYHAYIDAKKKP